MDESSSVDKVGDFLEILTWVSSWAAKNEM